MLHSSMLFADIIRHLKPLSTIRGLSAASRTLQVLLQRVPGVSLRFTPGSMLPAASRTLNLFWIAVPGVSLRFTPGSMLSAASRALQTFLD